MVHGQVRSQHFDFHDFGRLGSAAFRSDDSAIHPRHVPRENQRNNGFYRMRVPVQCRNTLCRQTNRIIADQFTHRAEFADSAKIPLSGHSLQVVMLGFENWLEPPSKREPSSCASITAAR